MISVYNIKPAFQRLLQPLLKWSRNLGITPNQLTIFAIILSIGMGISIWFSCDFPALILVVPIGYLLRMILNALDGMMATQYKMQSPLGELLNEMGDVISDAAIIFPLMVLPNTSDGIIIAFGVLALCNEFAGVLAKTIGGERRYDGPMGKSDRAVLIGLYTLLFYFWSGISLYANWIFGIAIVLVSISTIIRLRNSIK